MSISICKRFRFDAAHSLPYYKGKCANLHGHSFLLDVEVSGQVQDQGEKIGMIVDFADLKALVNDAVIDRVDHIYLNDHIKNPTAETLVELFVHRLDKLMFANNLELERLRLYETEDSYAEWRR